MSKKIDNMMNIFIENPHRRYNIREIGRMLKLSPTTCSKYLNGFARKGILKKERERNLVLFSADTENRDYKDLKIHLNIRGLRSSGLISFIERELNYPEVIILFGSFSKGENTKESDVDLFVLSESKRKLDMSRFESRIGARIQMFLHNHKEVEDMKRSNKELLNNIINGLRLSGFFEAFK